MTLIILLVAACPSVLCAVAASGPGLSIFVIG